jgi:hypothetical protein
VTRSPSDFAVESKERKPLVEEAVKIKKETVSLQDREELTGFLKEQGFTH